MSMQPVCSQTKLFHILVWLHAGLASILTLKGNNLKQKEKYSYQRVYISYNPLIFSHHCQFHINLQYCKSHNSELTELNTINHRALMYLIASWFTTEMVVTYNSLFLIISHDGLVAQQHINNCSKEKKIIFSW